MNASYVMQALSVCCFVLAAACGWASCVRARSWTYPGHWAGVAAIVSLAVVAWPERRQERPPPISDARVDSILSSVKTHYDWRQHHEQSIARRMAAD